MTDQALQEKNTLYAPDFVDSWEEQFLYPLADWINGMAFKDFNFTPNGKPVIKIAEIKNGVSSQTQFTDGQYNEVYLLKKGDMLFCWSGQPQTSIDIFWWDGPEGWLNQHIFKVIPKTENKIFFFYLLKYLKPNFVQIAINKQTTGLGHVTKGDLEQFIVKLPPPDKQRAIAAVLSPLDDKIELLIAQNRTLENIAQALFKRWFVDFEFPNSDGKPYKSSGGKMIDSELGAIPKGWKIGGMGEYCKVTRGASPRPIQDWLTEEKNNTPWIKISDATAVDSKFIFSTNQQIKNEGMKYSVIVDIGDLIVSNSATPGLPRIVQLRACVHDGWLIIRGFEETFSKWYLLILLDGLRESFIKQGSGAIFTNLKTDILKNQIIVVPDHKTMDIFDQTTSVLWNKISENTKQIQTLSRLRDVILPKLMRGEVRVKGFN